MKVSSRTKDRAKALAVVLGTGVALYFGLSFKGFGLKATEMAFGVQPDRFQPGAGFTFYEFKPTETGQWPLVGFATGSPEVEVKGHSFRRLSDYAEFGENAQYVESNGKGMILLQRSKEGKLLVMFRPAHRAG